MNHLTQVSPPAGTGGISPLSGGVVPFGSYEEFPHLRAQSSEFTLVKRSRGNARPLPSVFAPGGSIQVIVNSDRAQLELGTPWENP